MKREELKKIVEGITDEQLKAILDLNGADIEKARGDYEKINADLKTSNDTISTMTAELEGLKVSKASAEEWERKFNDLQKDIDEKEEAAKAAAEQAEKEANILNRFKAVSVDKDGKALEWVNEFTEAPMLFSVCITVSPCFHFSILSVRYRKCF